MAEIARLSGKAWVYAEGNNDAPQYRHHR
jgi:hypothetical protein